MSSSDMLPVSGIMATSTKTQHISKTNGVRKHDVKMLFSRSGNMIALTSQFSNANDAKRDVNI